MTNKKIEEVTEKELYKLSVYMQGVWWYADDEDNPFGIALLVCPDGDQMTYLYTLSGARAQLKARTKEPSTLCAGPSKNAALNKFGWGIRQNGKPIAFSLPVRLYNDAVRASLELQESNRSDLLKIRKEVAAFDKSLKRAEAVRKSRAEWAAWVEKRRGGEHVGRNRETGTGSSGRVNKVPEANFGGVDGSTEGDS